MRNSAVIEGLELENLIKEILDDEPRSYSDLATLTGAYWDDVGDALTLLKQKKLIEKVRVGNGYVYQKVAAK